MIYGIGTDIVEISRIKNAAQKWGERFLKKIFTENEIAYCYKKKDPFPHLAVRFAAKEAAIKALSSEDNEQKTEDRPTKIGNFKNIEILNHPSGKPFIKINTSHFPLLTSHFTIHLTLTHEQNYAVATVVLETKNS
jgi:holo-[acyl-carrier protein] synthase